MSETRHTPGPWELHQEGDGFNSVLVCVPEPATERGCRAVAEAEILGMDRREAEANARLIAAAPELLAALRDAVASLGGIHSDNVPDSIRVAIAKAEGR